MYFRHRVMELVKRNYDLFDLNENDIAIMGNAIERFDDVEYQCAPSSIAGTMIYVILKKKNKKIKIRDVTENFVTNCVIKKCNRKTGLRTEGMKRISMFAIIKWRPVVTKVLNEVFENESENTSC